MSPSYQGPERRAPERAHIVTVPERRRPLRRLPAVLVWFIGMALLGALALQVAGWWLVPWLDANPKRVQSLLTRELKRPVSFGDFEAVWRRSGPLLRLRDLEIADPTRRTPPLKLARAEFAVHIYAWTRPGSPWTEFRVVSPRLSLEREPTGRWRLRGFDGQSVGADGNVLLDIGRVSLKDASVDVFDQASGSRWQFDRVHARIESTWRGRRFGANARPRGSAQTVRVACRSDKDWREGRCFVAGLALALRDWQPQRATANTTWAGRMDLSAWFDWRRGHRSLRANIALQPVDAAAAMADSRRVDVPALALRRSRASQGAGSAPPDSVARSASTPPPAGKVRWRIAWQHSDNSTWQLDARHIAGDTLRVRGQGQELEVETPRLHVANGVPLLELAPQVTDVAREWLHSAAPEGVLVDVVARRSGKQWNHVGGTLQDVGWRPHGKIPGLSGLDARFLGDAAAILVVPDVRSKLIVTSPEFKAPIAIDWRGGVLGVLPTAGGARIEGTALDLLVDATTVSGRFGIEFVDGGGNPAADITLAVDRIAVDRLGNYWPRRSMPPKTVQWLDESLRQGEVREAQVVIHGDFDDWPFHGGAGRFEARARLADVGIQFRRDWPGVELDAGEVSFIGDAMHVDIARARTAGLEVTESTADIASLHAPMLEIRANGSGTGNAMLDYLRTSPIRKNVAAAVEGLSIEGSGDIDIALAIPLKKALGETRVEGSVELREVDIVDTKWNLALDDASGVLNFDRRSFVAEKWPVRFDGDAALLTLRSGEHVENGEQNEFEAELVGNFRAQSLLMRVPQLAPLGARFDGRSDFNVQVAIGHAQPDRSRLQRLDVTSTLRGVTLSLPAPLTKARAAALPIAVSVDLPFEKGEVRIEVGEILRARARAADASGPFSAHFALGARAMPEIPASGIRVSGRAKQIDVLGWVDLVRELDQHLEESAQANKADGGDSPSLAATSPAVATTARVPAATAQAQLADPTSPSTAWTAAQRFAGVDAAADSWLLGGRKFGALTVKGEVENEALHLSVAGADALGDVYLPLGADTPSRALSMTFRHLHFPEAPPPAKSTPKRASTIDPAKLPALVVDIDDLRLGRAQLGKVALRSRPLDRGMRVDSLTAKSQRLKLDAQGEWLRDERGERSQVLADFRSPDVGALLAALGFDGVIAGGTTSAQLNGQWRGAPNDFALAKIEGTLSVAVGAGRILEVEPGAGRVFGLVNLEAIRRRLALDFSDFFTPGMAFDRIDGDFQMRAGNAYTANVVLSAPAAEVRVRGRTGLAGKDYDQQVEVRPRVGSALPVVGAVAAGPAGAALGWVLQRALEKPLGFAARTRYRVTGPWAKPTITQIPRLPSLRAPRPEATDSDSS